MNGQCSFATKITSGGIVAEDGEILSMSGRAGFCNGAFIQALYGAPPVTRPRDSKRKQLKEEKKVTRMDNDIKETLGRGGRARSLYDRVKQLAAMMLLLKIEKGETE